MPIGTLRETILIIGIMDKEDEEDGKWTDDASEEAFRKRIEEASCFQENHPHTKYSK